MNQAAVDLADSCSVWAAGHGLVAADCTRRDQDGKQEGGLCRYVVSLCYGARKDDEGERVLCPMNEVCLGNAMEEHAKSE
jgi:hypothetical protein